MSVHLHEPKALSRWSIQHTVTKPFKTHWYNRKPVAWVARNPLRDAGTQESPECIRLKVVQGHTPSQQPPVRIFVGTEPGQYRATRALVWSIMKVRDPARVYEIYLMMELASIERDDWTTGFTNYRYLVPHLAGGAGRAIYNDTDQIYLSDPAEIFDMEMHTKAVLAISPQENSVMLIDCELAAPLWTADDVRAGHKHDHFKSIMIENQRVGELPGVWNSRDGEHAIEDVKCLHFTTLYKQPWKPFPDRLRYQTNPLGYVWRNLEAEADAEKFLMFNRCTPSVESQQLIALYEMMHGDELQAAEANPDVPRPFPGGRLPKHTAAIAELIDQHGAQTLLDYGAGKAGSYCPAKDSENEPALRNHPAWPGVSVHCYDPGYAPFNRLDTGPFDGVISTDVVEHAAPFDVAWILDEMFARASAFVYVVAACYPAKKSLPGGRNAHTTLQPPHWWHQQVSLTAKRYPQVDWVLVCEVKPAVGKKKRLLFNQASGCPLE